MTGSRMKVEEEHFASRYRILRLILDYQYHANIRDRCIDAPGLNRSDERLT
jgi:hypothetical protein